MRPLHLRILNTKRIPTHPALHNQSLSQRNFSVQSNHTAKTPQNGTDPAETPSISDATPIPSSAQLQERIKCLRAALAQHSRHLGREADRRFTILGLKINEVTGYREVEKLKLEVVRREDDLKILRETAKSAKEAYDQAVTTRSDSQRDVNSLLERKHSWTDSDVSRFTQLVRADHSSSTAVTTTAAELKQAEMAVDKGFSDLMQAILERYHEEQVWSDKIRSVSTWASIVALAANMIVFVGAIAFIEPWKRRRLVQGLEERITEMMDRVEGSVVALSGRIDEVEEHLVAGIPNDITDEIAPTRTASPLITPSQQYPRLKTVLPWPHIDAISQPSVERDLAAVGVCGLAGGVVIASIINIITRKA